MTFKTPEPALSVSTILPASRSVRPFRKRPVALIVLCVVTLLGLAVILPTAQADKTRRPSPGTGSSAEGLNGVVTCGTPGALDPSFDTDGMAFTTFNGGTLRDEAYAVALQPDGKTVVAGMSQRPSNQGLDFAVARYNADGSLDGTFGTGGKVTTDIGTLDEAYALVVQTDGKIVAAGYTHSGSAANMNFALVRYDTNGTLDPSFGTGGVVNSDLGSDPSRIHALALQPDGKIVAAGYAQSTFGSSADFAVARYNTDGSLDNTFSGDGYTTDSGGVGFYAARAVVIQSDGKIVVAGTGPAAFVLRLNADGTPDTSFSGNGDLDIQNIAIAAAAQQPDGRIVLAGSDSTRFMTARLNTDGTLDLSYGLNGKASASVGSGGNGVGGASAVMVEHDGMIMTAGSAMGSEGVDVGLVRFYPNGALDPSFGTGGKALVALSANPDRAAAAALLPDGRVVTAGYSDAVPLGNTDFAVARFIGRSCAGEVTVAEGSTYLADGGSLGFGIGSVGTAGAARTFTIRNDGTQTLSLGAFTFTGAHPGDFSANTAGTAASLAPGATTSFTLTFTPGGPGPRAASLNIANGDPDEDPFELNLSGTGHTGVLFTVTVTSAYGTVTSIPAGMINCPGDCSESFDEGSGTTILLLASARSGYRFAGWSGDASGGTPTLTVQVNGNKNITANYVPITSFDFDVDTRADLSVFRPSNNTWYFQTGTGFSLRQFGQAGDVLVPADYDGDNVTDVAVYRPSNGTLYWITSSTNGYNVRIVGNDPNEIFIPMELGGVGSSSVMFHPSVGRFRRVGVGVPEPMQLGSGYLPLRGDFDGDRKHDFAAYNPTTHVWRIFRSAGGEVTITWGADGDKAVPADYDNDGRADIAVYRPSTGQWHIIGSSAGWMVKTWGEPGDIPAPADYDGDGRADVAIFRPSTGMWYVVFSATGNYYVRQFGQDGDVPLASAFVR